MLAIFKNETKRNADIYQHMTDESQGQHDAQTLDSATADQASHQEGAVFPEMQSDADSADEETDSSLLWMEREQDKVLTHV
mgnify:CR=1 FL=1